MTEAEDFAASFMAELASARFYESYASISFSEVENFFLQDQNAAWNLYDLVTSGDGTIVDADVIEFFDNLAVVEQLGVEAGTMSSIRY